MEKEVKYKVYYKDKRVSLEKFCTSEAYDTAEEATPLLDALRKDKEVLEAHIKREIFIKETVVNEESLYGVGDLVLVPRGQKTIFFEVTKVEEDRVWVSNGWVQIQKSFDEIELICKATNRQDEKVPKLIYHK